MLTEEHDAAACQRNLEQRYPSLEEQREQYTELVRAFHAEHIASSFPIPDYVMDVYITASGRVRVSYCTCTAKYVPSCNGAASGPCVHVRASDEGKRHVRRD